MGWRASAGFCTRWRRGTSETSFRPRTARPFRGGFVRRRVLAIGGRERRWAPTALAEGCASKGRAMLVDEFDDANAIASLSMSTEAAAVEDAAAAAGAAMEPAEGSARRL